LAALIGFVGLCLLVGMTGASITAPAVRGWYLTLRYPPGTPANWVFPVVWTVLYVLIGVSAWRVWRRVGTARVIRVWGWQLALGAAWSPAFFGLHSPAAGLVVIVPFWFSIVWTIRGFAPIDRPAAWMLAPYLAWVSYATYLNAGFWWLNAV
jgi:tryptophan-rich sensory protein